MQVNRQIQIKPGDLRCPTCFALDIVPSMPRGISDALMRMLRRIPRHCRACGRRFYIRDERSQKQERAAG